MEYDQLLAAAPPHDSPEFIQYLRENNTVEYEDDQWIVIQNFKYHTPDRPWLTAFAASPHHSLDRLAAIIRVLQAGEWTWLKKPYNKQTVKRFHIHIYRD